MRAMIQLFIVLWVLYLGECVVRIRRGNGLLHAPFGRAFRFRAGESMAQVGGQGLSLLQVLPPLGWAYELSNWPIAISPEGVASRPASRAYQSGFDEELGRSVRFSKLERIEYQENRLLLNGSPFATFADATQSRAVAELLSELRVLDETDREGRLSTVIRERFSIDGIRENSETVSAHLQWLVIMENLLFAFLIVLLPLSLYFLGAGRWSLYLLLATLFLWIQTLFAFSTAHAELRSLGLPSRAWAVFQMVCLAPGAIRGHFLLSRPAFHEKEPAAVMAVLLAGDRRDHELRRIVCDLRWPIPAPEEEDPLVESVVSWYRGIALQAMGTLSVELELGADAFEEHPPELPMGDGAWCPRCATVYERQASSCRDCGGRELLRSE